MTDQLTGKIALVTGAGVRLGRAFALGLAEAGADILVHYNRSQAPAEETAELVRNLGRRAVSVGADLSDLEQTQGLLPLANEKLGPVSILINSAAIFEAVTATETTPAVWQRHQDINLRAPVLLTQALAASLAGSPGAVVNLLDWRALRPGPDHFAYTIAKAGLAAATQSLARALAPNIRVNGLALGAILPPADDGETPPSKIIEQVPLGRWGQVDEAVEAMLFLVAGPGYLTGEIMLLDGGRHLV